MPLDPLDQESLKRIIVEPKNSLVRQYKKLFSLDGIDIEFDDSAIAAVAAKAIALSSGARGLRSVFENAMMKLMFERPGRKDVSGVRITGAFINGEAEPELIFRQLPSGNDN